MNAVSKSSDRLLVIGLKVIAVWCILTGLIFLLAFIISFDSTISVMRLVVFPLLSAGHFIAAAGLWKKTQWGRMSAAILYVFLLVISIVQMSTAYIGVSGFPGTAKEFSLEKYLNQNGTMHDSGYLRRFQILTPIRIILFIIDLVIVVFLLSKPVSTYFGTPRNGNT